MRSFFQEEMERMKSFWMSQIRLRTQLIIQCKDHLTLELLSTSKKI